MTRWSVLQEYASKRCARGTSPRFAVLLIVAVVVALTAACAGGGGSAPPSISGDVTQGQQLFEQTCSGCHSAPGIMPQDLGALPADQIRRTVRQGKEGVMPQFSESELSDQQLNDIIAYLKSLQRQ